MTKSELVGQLASEKNISHPVAEKIVTEIFKSMTGTLVSGGRLEIRGFGSFEVREYNGYTARNPKTGVQLEVTRINLPSSKPVRTLKYASWMEGRRIDLSEELPFFCD
jgi:integration host factor subunit beta